jgi:hypothetical protein
MYELNYDSDGKVSSISKLNNNGSVTSFGLNECNADYQTFLQWNSRQVVPLDLKSTIEVIKPDPPVDLIKEIETIKGRLDILESTDAPSSK